MNNTLKSLIYLPNAALGIGGGEATIAAFAELLEQYGDVQVLSGKPDLTTQAIAKHFDVRLARTTFRLYDHELVPWRDVRNPFRRERMMQEFDRRLTGDFDLFIPIPHVYPPFSAAKASILHVLYPWESPMTQAPPLESGAGLIKHFRRKLKRHISRDEIRKRLTTYPIKTANSQFTSDWTQRRWGGSEWRVWYPPVTLIPAGDECPRGKTIIGVGRFVAEGYKMQQELAQWFKELVSSHPDARLTLAGTCSSKPADQKYLADARAISVGAAVDFQTDLPLLQLRSLYQTAKVFWHAMGYGVAKDQPERCEHFGMTTVEAMSAGCVPVVVDRGGQTEIVEHGVSGFRWQTPEELIRYSEMLLRDEALWSAMSTAAIERAKSFSREMFDARVNASLVELGLIPAYTASGRVAASAAVTDGYQ